MASSRSECPKCRSSKNVRLLSESMTKFKYWCSECRTPFEIPKTNKRIRKEHPPK